MKPQSHSTFRRLLLVVITISAISVFGQGVVDAQEAPGNGENTVAAGPGVEAVSETEWRIINPAGEFEGTLKSTEQKAFTFFDAEGMFIGTITESGDWLHRLYRKRDTRITPDEARLYIDALKVIELIKK